MYSADRFEDAYTPVNATKTAFENFKTDLNTTFSSHTLTYEEHLLDSRYCFFKNGSVHCPERVGSSSTPLPDSQYFLTITVQTTNAKAARLTPTAADIFDDTLGYCSEVRDIVTTAGSTTHSQTVTKKANFDAILAAYQAIDAGFTEDDLINKRFVGSETVFNTTVVEAIPTVTTTVGKVIDADNKQVVYMILHDSVATHGDTIKGQLATILA